MKIGVISDTHDNIRNTRRAAEIFREEGVELVLHLGDIIAPFTLQALVSSLENIRVVAVYGNNCGEKLGLKRVAEKLGVDIGEPPRELEVEGKRILLLHGFGSPEITRKLVYALARGGEWNIILYGHTHVQDYARLENDAIVLNPGEAAGVLNEATVAVLDLDSLSVRFYRI